MLHGRTYLLMLTLTYLAHSVDFWFWSCSWLIWRWHLPIPRWFNSCQMDSPWGELAMWADNMIETVHFVSHDRSVCLRPTLLYSHSYLQSQQLSHSLPSLRPFTTAHTPAQVMFGVLGLCCLRFGVWARSLTKAWEMNMLVNGAWIGSPCMEAMVLIMYSEYI